MPKLKMFPATNGDAFLIRSDSLKPVVILIDGGFVDTFLNHILADLISLNEEGCRLNLIVATHIDADHIAGLIEFFKQNGHSSNPKIIAVDQVLHNSIRSIDGAGEGIIDTGDLELLNEIKRQGFPVKSEEREPQYEIGAKQGSSLAALLLSGEYHWNARVGNSSINCEETPSLAVGENIQVQVIGPKIDRLKELKAWWMRELRRFGLVGELCEREIFDDAFEFLCANQKLNLKSSFPQEISGTSKEIASLTEVYKADRSETNASSIVFIATIDSIKMLFLGDALAEDIELELKALLDASKSINFDVIKISHHGSMHSTSPSLLKLIDAPVFLISSNGQRHGHPDIEVLREIVDRPCDFNRKLYFNLF